MMTRDEKTGMIAQAIAVASEGEDSVSAIARLILDAAANVMVFGVDFKAAIERRERLNHD